MDRQSQRMRDNASSLYAVVLFCKWYFQENNWSSEEFRQEYADTALGLCKSVLRTCNGEDS